MSHLPTRRVIIAGIGIVACGILITLSLFKVHHAIDLPESGFLTSWLGEDQPPEGAILVEVDVESRISEYLEQILDSFRIDLRVARIGYSRLGIADDRIVFAIRDPGRIEYVIRSLDELWPELVASRSGTSFELHIADQLLSDIHGDILRQTLNAVVSRLHRLGFETQGVRTYAERCILIPPFAAQAVDKSPRDLHGRFPSLTFKLIDTNIDPGATDVPIRFSVLSASEENYSQLSEQYVVQKRVKIAGRNIVDTTVELEDGRPVISARFDLIGRQDIRRMQPAPDQLVAVVLRGEVIAAVGIETRLPSTLMLRGDFTSEQAGRLAHLMRSLVYPAPVKVVDKCAP